MFGDRHWGAKSFGGLGFKWDPQRVFTDRQKKLQADFIELCRTTVRETSPAS